MQGVCSHCYKFAKVTKIGNWLLCDTHKELKQFQVKKKAPGGLKRTKINPRSDKKKDQDSEIKRIMKVLPATCTGCKNPMVDVEPSHLIPRSQNSLLITYFNNIRPHCRECHTKWEHKQPGVELMCDYQENLDRIKTMDLMFYNRLMNK